MSRTNPTERKSRGMNGDATGVSSLVLRVSAEGGGLAVVVVAAVGVGAGATDGTGVVVAGAGDGTGSGRVAGSAGGACPPRIPVG